MSDILLLLGAALCALSVLMAIVSLLRTQPPRGAAIALVLGIVLMFSGAQLSQGPFGVETLSGAAQRLVNGQISLSGDADTPTVTAPPPAAPAPAAAQPSQ